MKGTKASDKSTKGKSTATQKTTKTTKAPSGTTKKNDPPAKKQSSTISKTNKEKAPESKINDSSSSSNSYKDKMILDFKEILKPSLIRTSDEVDIELYIELMRNLERKDDVKTLAICRLILSQEKNNPKIQELHDLIYESIKQRYAETGEISEQKEEVMDKHMKLNKDGEYEYFSSSEEDEK